MIRPIIAVTLILCALLRCGDTAYAGAVTGFGLGASNNQSHSALVSTWRRTGAWENGQSLSIGLFGTPVITTTQPYSNLQLFDSSSNYTITLPNAGTLSEVPAIAVLRQPLVGADVQYPVNMGGEDPGLGFVDDVTRQALAAGYPSFVQTITSTGISGQPYSVVGPGGSENAYAAGLYEIRAHQALTAVSITGVTLGSPTTITAAGHSLATGNYTTITGIVGTTEANGYWQATVVDSSHFTIPVASTHAYSSGGTLTSFGVEAQVISHGESDWNNASYLTDIETWQSTGQANIQTITGQTQAVPLILSQTNGDTESGGAVGVALSSYQQGAAVGQPGIYVSGPKYQYVYGASVGPHLTPASYRLAGEKMSEAYWAIHQGVGWTPLYATGLTTNSSTSYTVAFHVPVPPLHWDTSLSQPHASGTLSVWANSYGFEAYDETTLTVTAATNASPIELTISPNTSSLVTGYAVSIQGVGGNTCANGYATITVVDGTHITLTGTTGNAAYTSGGTLWILLPISSVTLNTGASTVTIVTSRAPTGQIQIGYADTADNLGSPCAPNNSVSQGCPGGRCGLLSDSDGYTGYSGTSQRNYALEFVMQ